MAMSPFRRAFLILLVAAGVVALGLLFAQDQVTLHLRSSVSAEDSRHPEYVAALVGTELSRGNAFDVLTNGDQIFPAMLAAIDAARRRISFETYIFDTGEVAARFTEALERAARRGVAPVASRTVRAWISTRTGRDPSIAGNTLVPLTGSPR